MPAYDAVRYDPPAPVARVSLRDPRTQTTLSDIVLLLDTGADVTLLPRAAVASLGVAPVEGEQFELMGFDGQRSSASAVEVDVIWGRKAYRGRYVIVDAEHGILGRDVLNNMRLLFDGPGGEWSEA